jgi:hypothetical protein
LSVLLKHYVYKKIDYDPNLIKMKKFDESLISAYTSTSDHSINFDKKNENIIEDNDKKMNDIHDKSENNLNEKIFVKDEKIQDKNDKKKKISNYFHHFLIFLFFYLPVETVTFMFAMILVFFSTGRKKTF